LGVFRSFPRQFSLKSGALRSFCPTCVAHLARRR
jgi:hypothetical protein